MPSKPEETPPAVTPATGDEIYGRENVRDFQAAIERGKEAVRAEKAPGGDKGTEEV